MFENAFTIGKMSVFQLQGVIRGMPFPHKIRDITMFDLLKVFDEFYESVYIVDKALNETYI